MPLLNVFGELERFTTEVLYPYRYVVTPILVALGVAAVYVAYRAGVHLWVRGHAMLGLVVGLPLLAGALYAGDYLVSPLWERSHLEEASPLAVVTSAPSATEEPDMAAMPVATVTPAPPPQATPSQAPQSTPAEPAFQPRVVLRGMSSERTTSTSGVATR